MDDLIRRKDAIKAFNGKIIMIGNESQNNFTEYIDRVLSEIQTLPSVTLRGDVKGKWKRTYLDHEAMGERPSIFYCSECNQCIPFPTNFCPGCGADMRGEEDD